MKLPLGQPAIVAYPVHLNHLSVISRNTDYEPWFYSNYIQLSCPPEFPHDRTKIMNFFNYDFDHPFYDTSPFAANTRTERIGNQDSIITSFIQLLDNQKYLSVYADDYELPFRGWYQTEHLPHELFLYGYDLDSAVFYALGYQGPGIPGEQTVTFKDFVQAYTSASALITANYADCHWMHFDYQLEYKANHYPLDLELIIQSIESYLQSTEFDLMPGTVCGISVYGLLKDYYHNWFHSLTAFDVRPFHLLWEHKNLMCKRIDFIQKYTGTVLSHLLSVSDELQKDFLNLRNRMLKEQISRQKTPPGLFAKIIDVLIEREVQLLSALVQQLGREADTFLPQANSSQA